MATIPPALTWCVSTALQKLCGTCSRRSAIRRWHEPYDDVSWELPAHYHLQAIHDGLDVRSAALAPLTEQPSRRATWWCWPSFLMKDTGQEKSSLRVPGGFNIENRPNMLSGRWIDFSAGRGSARHKWLIDAVRSTATILGLDFASRCPYGGSDGTRRSTTHGVWVRGPIQIQSAGCLLTRSAQGPVHLLRDEDIRAEDARSPGHRALRTWTSN